MTGYWPLACWRGKWLSLPRAAKWSRGEGIRENLGLATAIQEWNGMDNEIWLTDILHNFVVYIDREIDNNIKREGNFQLSLEA